MFPLKILLREFGILVFKQRNNQYNFKFNGDGKLE